MTKTRLRIVVGKDMQVRDVVWETNSLYRTLPGLVRFLTFVRKVRFVPFYLYSQ